MQGDNDSGPVKTRPVRSWPCRRVDALMFIDVDLLPAWLVVASAALMLLGCLAAACWLLGRPFAPCARACPWYWAARLFCLLLWLLSVHGRATVAALSRYNLPGHAAGSLRLALLAKGLAGFFYARSFTSLLRRVPLPGLLTVLIPGAVSAAVLYGVAGCAGKTCSCTCWAGASVAVCLPCWRRSPVRCWYSGSWARSIGCLWRWTTGRWSAWCCSRRFHQRHVDNHADGFYPDVVKTFDDMHYLETRPCTPMGSTWRAWAGSGPSIQVAFPQPGEFILVQFEGGFIELLFPIRGVCVSPRSRREGIPGRTSNSGLQHVRKRLAPHGRKLGGQARCISCSIGRYLLVSR